ncbi:hypothetical protein VAE151_530048 [Vibrio aestuarianus]|uniref:Uncharacterized protein n=1 Tax=Vibrio aestuarianus TaxID=28171 RepID=A0ABM9FNT0_9VIBR|nr:hypothetical protein VAE308_1010518 [Vibrio aestuarianus]CAH8189326.1 hypothetical protein VIBAE_A30519 [Vibrio aestuarianus subsp. francensis]CAH8189238.1 hypothetical protein VAE032_250048 [Vibrio aestuarianus]CAH8189381.1 hypothetical protein VAE055_350048 [Vibrio aestuarianus]CAH8189528.1 hypothetical protein VAE128_440521 [Vibrio aestuarianus]
MSERKNTSRLASGKVRQRLDIGLEWHAGDFMG